MTEEFAALEQRPSFREEVRTPAGQLVGRLDKRQGLLEIRLRGETAVLNLRELLGDEGAETPAAAR